jgi:hypothetical protein
MDSNLLAALKLHHMTIFVLSTTANYMYMFAKKKKFGTYQRTIFKPIAIEIEGRSLQKVRYYMY